MEKKKKKKEKRKRNPRGIKEKIKPRLNYVGSDEGKRTNTELKDVSEFLLLQRPGLKDVIHKASGIAIWKQVKVVFSLGNFSCET